MATAKGLTNSSWPPFAEATRGLPIRENVQCCRQEMRLTSVKGCLNGYERPADTHSDRLGRIYDHHSGLEPRSQTCASRRPTILESQVLIEQPRLPPKWKSPLCFFLPEEDSAVIVG